VLLLPPLQHLQHFIHYTYTFYTGLLEEQALYFLRRVAESLGDLAYYCMVVAVMVKGAQGPGPEELTTAAISAVLTSSPNPSLPTSSTPDYPSNMSVKSSLASEY
jgi:hypothetical protein